VKRKILITLVVLAAGLVTLLGYDIGAEMFQNTTGVLHFYGSKFVSSALSSLGIQGVGIILMVVVITAGVLLFRGKDDDTMYFLALCSRHLRRTMVRESDERLGLNELIPEHLTDSRRKNTLK
jgi:hypothetical protein